jgi:hypothetical protein
VCGADGSAARAIPSQEEAILSPFCTISYTPAGHTCTRLQTTNVTSNTVKVAPYATEAWICRSVLANVGLSIIQAKRVGI